MVLGSSVISFEHQNRAIFTETIATVRCSLKELGHPKTLSFIRDVTLDEKGTKMMYLILKEAKKENRQHLN